MNSEEKNENSELCWSIFKKGHPSQSAYHHEVWKKTLEQYTGWQYTLEREYVSDIHNWKRRVAEITQNNSGILEIVNGQKLVMTSVSSIEGSTYRTGHIVTILGTDFTDKSSASKTIFFNGAIKVGKVRGEEISEIMCRPRDLSASKRYSAGVFSTNQFDLKFYGTGYLILYLKKKY